MQQQTPNLVLHHTIESAFVVIWSLLIPRLKILFQIAKNPRHPYIQENSTDPTRLKSF